MSKDKFMESEMITIFNTYGVENQIRKLQEEIDEFKKEVYLYDNHVGSKENMAAEYADALNVIEQFKLHYGFEDDDIESKRKYKLDREIIRMKNNKETDDRNNKFLVNKDDEYITLNKVNMGKWPSRNNEINIHTNACNDLGNIIVYLKANSTSSRELSLALTKMEEALMWLKKDETNKLKGGE